VQDAALLAVLNSRARAAGRVKVTLTRARHVSKPAGTKAGTVQLSGQMLYVDVNAKAEGRRMARLELKSEAGAEGE